MPGPRESSQSFLPGPRQCKQIVGAGDLGQLLCPLKFIYTEVGVIAFKVIKRFYRFSEKFIVSNLSQKAKDLSL